MRCHEQKHFPFVGEGKRVESLSGDISPPAAAGYETQVCSKPEFLLKGWVSKNMTTLLHKSC